MFYKLVILSLIILVNLIYTLSVTNNLRSGSILALEANEFNTI